MFEIDKSVNLVLRMQNLLYREFTNVILSPFSLEILFFAILAGIDGDCFEELVNCLFGKSVPSSEVAESIRCFKMLISHIGSVQNVDFKMNNFIYISDKYEVQQSYVDFIFHYLNTRLRQINFEDETLEAYSRIDQDVRTASLGRIDKILKCLPTVSRLMLVSHVSFQSELKYAPSKQYDGKFHAANQDDVDVRFTIHQNDYKYCSNSEFAFLVMPYKNEEMNLCLVLPNEGASIRDIVNKLNYGKFAELQKSSVPTSLEVHLPSTKIQSNVDLAMVLQLSGICKVFEEDNANFFKMVGNSKSLYLESVVTHSELILQDLSKIGNSIELVAPAPTPTVEPTIILDRPFIYFVVCCTKKLQSIILFSGVVNVIEK